MPDVTKMTTTIHSCATIFPPSDMRVILPCADCLLDGRPLPLWATAPCLSCLTSIHPLQLHKLCPRNLNQPHRIPAHLLPPIPIARYVASLAAERDARTSERKEQAQAAPPRPDQPTNQPLTAKPKKGKRVAVRQVGF